MAPGVLWERAWVVSNEYLIKRQTWICLWPLNLFLTHNFYFFFNIVEWLLNVMVLQYMWQALMLSFFNFSDWRNYFSPQMKHQSMELTRDYRITILSVRMKKWGMQWKLADIPFHSMCIYNQSRLKGTLSCIVTGFAPPSKKYSHSCLSITPKKFDNGWGCWIWWHIKKPSTNMTILSYRNWSPWHNVINNANVIRKIKFRHA
jgi:hypothetical protein